MIKKKQLIKLLFLFTLILYFLSLNSSNVLANPENNLIELTEGQLEILDTREVERFINEIDRELAEFIPEFTIEQFITNLKNGDIHLNPQGFLNGIGKFLMREVGANLALMGKLILLAIICAVLSNLQNAFEQDNISKLAHMVSFLVLITLAVGSFQMTMEIGKVTIDRMVSFMQILMPVLLALLAALGAFTTTAILHPFILVTLGILSTFFKVIIFPLVYFEAILKLVNYISEKFKISRLVDLFKDATKFCLGLSFTLFIGALSLQGVGGAVADGITLRTAKYMSGAFIPVVGGMFADALDAVIGGSLLLKNAIGLVGLVVIGVITLFPMLKIIAIVIIYKLAAALIQPIGDTKVADTLQGMANSLLLVFASVATVSLMFFLTIIIIMVTANVTVMLR
ncbi:MAG: stage III sporulation protein AE [Clostridia bacterium]|nr:stage III sporulation protein AE [Clostridia bacterium]